MQGHEDEDRYVQYFREREVIELYKTMIQKNATKRMLAKLYLNSFLNKLMESSNRRQNNMVEDPQEEFRYLEMPGCVGYLDVYGRGREYTSTSSHD